MAFCPVNKGIFAQSGNNPGTKSARNTSAVKCVDHIVSIVAVGYRHIRGIFFHPIDVACGTLIHFIFINCPNKNFSIIVHALVNDRTPEPTAFRRQGNVFCSIPPDTVHTIVLQLLHIIRNFLLHQPVFRIQIRHTDISMRDLPAVLIINITACMMPVLRTFQIRINIAVISCQMICNHIHNHFNSIFVRLCTKSLQICLRSQSGISHSKTIRLVQIIPDTVSLHGQLRRRRLYR